MKVSITRNSMMKKFTPALVLILLIFGFTPKADGLGSKLNRNKLVSIDTSTNSSKLVDNTLAVEVNIDTLSYLKITRIIYYQQPLCFEYDSLTDTNYIPNWYRAHCANSNIDYFKDYPKEAIGLLQKRMGTTEEDLANYAKRTKAKGGRKKVSAYYMYIYGEIWLTYLKTGEQFEFIMKHAGKLGIKGNPNFKFKQPVAKNQEDEKTDSIDNNWGMGEWFIFEDDLLKYADLSYVNEKIFEHNTLSWDFRLANFKNMLYRVPEYTCSLIKDGKRIFETIENTAKGPVVKSVSDKP